MTRDGVFGDYTDLTVWRLHDRGFSATEIAKMCAMRVTKVVTILKAPRPAEKAKPCSS